MSFAQWMIRRLLFTLIALVGAMIIMFGLSRVGGDPRYILLNAPVGDPLAGARISKERWEALGVEMGLDKHVLVQFGIWVRDCLRLDFGDSIKYQRAVSAVVRDRIAATLQLGLAAWVVGTAVGIPLGVFSALNRGRVIDLVARGFAIVGQAAPAFWTAIMLIYLFAVRLDWLPVGTRGQGFSIQHFILPTVTLAWLPASAYLRFTRNAMLDVLDSQYVVLARSKGVSRASLVWKHAFRNALVVPLTLSALLLVGFVSGSVVVEVVFAWPGLGLLTIGALQQNDFPLLCALVLLYGVLYVAMIFILDVVYVFIDPRIRRN